MIRLADPDNTLIDLYLDDHLRGRLPHVKRTANMCHAFLEGIEAIALPPFARLLPGYGEPVCRQI